MDGLFTVSIIDVDGLFTVSIIIETVNNRIDNFYFKKLDNSGISAVREIILFRVYKYHFETQKHTFSAFWLRSSVVSVLISLISGTRTNCSPDD